MRKFSKFSIKQRDEFLVVISIFGIIGSILIFQSYARNYVDMETPGFYSASDINMSDQNIEKKHKSSYLKINQNTDVSFYSKVNVAKMYCLVAHSTSTNEVTLVFEGYSKIFTVMSGLSDKKLGCINVDRDKGKFTIKSDNDLYVKGIKVE